MKKYLSILLVAFIFTACKKEAIITNPSEASFSTNIKAGSEPSEKDLIQFTNTSTGTNTYFWDFGNGTSSTETHPAVSYNIHGIYTVTLTVKDNQGNTSSYSQYVTILCKFKNKNHTAAEEL